ncbi:hypothetical protein J2D73_16700 [Acetobacter sacchari]|uniref:Uncharacterized protein n=1 Tax=Acetobacter sacchari TaxID=2661687 RepID=A0ABS3LZY8_9PROT|nr:hypothetical protein [Acetobacter sacchari]MBO1361426.1 hypothetical protein [Acetobacter sacchari]
MNYEHETICAAAPVVVWAALGAPVTVTHFAIVDRDDTFSVVDSTLSQAAYQLTPNAIAATMAGYLAAPIAHRICEKRVVDALWDWRVADPYVQECEKFLAEMGYGPDRVAIFSHAMDAAEFALGDPEVWRAVQTLARHARHRHGPMQRRALAAVLRDVHGTCAGIAGDFRIAGT